MPSLLPHDLCQRQSSLPALQEYNPHLLSSKTLADNQQQNKCHLYCFRCQSKNLLCDKIFSFHPDSNPQRHVEKLRLKEVENTLGSQWKRRIETWLSDSRVVCCYCLVGQSCPTLCNPMNCNPPGSSVHGILQARIVEGVAISFSRGSSPPRDWACISCIGIVKDCSHVCGTLCPEEE